MSEPKQGATQKDDVLRGLANKDTQSEHVIREKARSPTESNRSLNFMLSQNERMYKNQIEQLRINQEENFRMLTRMFEYQSGFRTSGMSQN